MPNELINLGSPLSKEDADVLKKSVPDLAVVLTIDGAGNFAPFVVPDKLGPESVFPIELVLARGTPPQFASICRWVNGKWRCS